MRPHRELPQHWQKVNHAQNHKHLFSHCKTPHHRQIHSPPACYKDHWVSYISYRWNTESRHNWSLLSCHVDIHSVHRFHQDNPSLHRPLAHSRDRWSYNSPMTHIIQCSWWAAQWRWWTIDLIFTIRTVPEVITPRVDVVTRPFATLAFIRVILSIDQLRCHVLDAITNFMIEQLTQLAIRTR